MEKELRNIFQYSRDAVLCIKGKRILYANGSAAKLFMRDLSGEIASRQLPAHLLDCSADSFVSSAEIFGRSYAVSAAHLQDVLILTFQTDRDLSPKTGLVSDGLTASMTSALCNIGFSVDLVSKRMEDDGDECRQLMSIVYHNYYSLKRLIGNLSSALAFDTGTAPFLPRSTDLARLCSELVSTSSLLLRDRAEICFSTTLGELMANVDPDLIERLLLNLISNSIAHTPPDGKITLGLKSSGGKAVISVDDNGSGIPPQILKNVFSGYELSVSDDLTREPSGGLGLWICLNIAKAHGGSIIVESREGIGTSVRVMLPLDNASFAEPSPPPEPSMENILTEFSCVLKNADYSRELLD